MCTTVLTRDREITNVRDLAALFGCEPETLPGAAELIGFFREEKLDADWRDSCLCHIDVRKAAKQHGYRATFNGLGFDLARREDA